MPPKKVKESDLAQKSYVAEVDNEESKRIEMPNAERSTSVAPTEGEMQAQRSALLEELEAQPKIRIRLYQVPHDSNDEKLEDVMVGINGYVYQLQRGVSVDVPEEVANILERGGYI